MPDSKFSKPKMSRTPMHRVAAPVTEMYELICSTHHAKTSAYRCMHTALRVAAASAGLPGGWRAFYDDKERSVYYGNAETGETRWDPPTVA